MNGIIISALIRLTKDKNSRKRQLEIIDYRKHTQPYKDKSAGCVFRNPECSSAGMLIDKSGLKGKGIGDAKISEKHANFIVNSGNATCKDFLELISLVKSQVKEQTGIELESEVRCIPYEQ
jgi:UDP-N-acetylmuramate dehydrogenase